MREPKLLEAGIDFDRANAARMYDYLLGGAHNFAVDRERAEQAIAARPELVFMAQANRAFLGRVVRWCVQRGVDQFLDLGSGVPTVGNVHEVAHALDPTARIAYVDFEPVAVAHATDIIGQAGETDTVTVTRADARDPFAVLAAPGVAGLLDFDRPVALLAVALLHFVDGDIADLLTRYRAALAPGGVVAISHVSDDQPDPHVAEQMRAMRGAYISSATPMILRDHAALLRRCPGSSSSRPGWSTPPSGPTSPTSARPGPTAGWPSSAFLRQRSYRPIPRGADQLPEGTPSRPGGGGCAAGRGPTAHGAVPTGPARRRWWLPRRVDLRAAASCVHSRTHAREVTDRRGPLPTRSFCSYRHAEPPDGSTSSVASWDAGQMTTESDTARLW